jgi:transcriptional regulator with XRE-family HTH domain
MSRSATTVRTRLGHRARQTKPAAARLNRPHSSPAREPTQATTLVGATLREQRRHLNLTIQEVADRVGITKGFLSEIERDLAAPSVATLLKLRDALSLSVSSLFRSSLPQIVRHNDRQDIPYGGLGMNCSLASARNAHRLTALHAEFKPLGLSGSEPHSLDSDEEFLLILAGTLEVMINDEVHLLQEGDSVTFDPRMPHSFKNPSRRTIARTLCIMAPPPK